MFNRETDREVNTLQKMRCLTQYSTQRSAQRCDQPSPLANYFASRSDCMLIHGVRFNRGPERTHDVQSRYEPRYEP